MRQRLVRHATRLRSATLARHVALAVILAAIALAPVGAGRAAATGNDAGMSPVGEHLCGWY